MTDFKKSSWSSKDFQEQYLDNADIYVLERRRLLGLVGELYKHFYRGRPGVRLLDLGCGDGILAHEILKLDPSIHATLVDGSQNMLIRADARLGMYANVGYVRASFEELLSGESDIAPFDLAVSSFSIHHLTMPDKSALFAYLYDRASDGGWFVNIDTVLPVSEEMEQWYFELWKQWMTMMQKRLGVECDVASEVAKRYKDDAVNKPDTLEDQLGALRECGFRDVDCFYKNGIFAVFGGRK
jgi:tRNA (cmo5U34)-methyltransferase